MKENVVFFGAGPYVSRIVEVLIHEFEVYVFTTENRQRDPLILYCANNNISYDSINKFDQKIIANIKKIGAKIAVLASFGLIVPTEVLEIFPLGIINIHPSLLPKYRGPTPVQSTILAGEKTTGVSIIELDEEVDHGPILTQIEEKIEPNDTSETLYRRLFQKGAELLSGILPKYIAGELKPVEQNHSRATFTDRLTRQSGLIDLNQPLNAKRQTLDRMIRAYFPWPGVWFRAKLNGVERTVKLFPEGRIQVEGKSVMSLKDFANGYPEAKNIISKLNLS